jgi:small-conductance mechanosensitive channel
MRALVAMIGRACGRASAVLGFALALHGTGWAAEPVSAGPVEVTAAETESAPADLVIANRPILTLRASVLAVSAAERARSVAERADVLVDRGGPLRVTTRPIPEGIVFLVDDQPLFRVFPGDLDPEGGEDIAQVASGAAGRLQLAFGEMREARDSRALVPALGRSLLVTLVLLGLWWLIWRGYRWLARRVGVAFQRKSQQLAPGWGQHVFGRAGAMTLVKAPIRILCWAAALLLLYEWVAFVLGQFPYTRPWGERLISNLVDAFGTLGTAILQAIPKLLFVLFIFLVTRMIVRLVKIFFEGVAAQRIDVGWVDESTARPTERLVTAVIWLFALVAAYPYLPGSGSEAFKGIGVFVGLMLSIGSSGIVNQAVSGLMLMYTRSIRTGEFVQIGETEGTVRSIGFLTTRVETLRHEEINIPNAVIAASVTRNYSRLAGDGGVRAATKVTIGYDTPWRQVQAMLMMAAGRTEAAAQEPPPRVLQTALQDFYVEYTLLVTVLEPARRVAVLNELHGHIQDVFNEHGVQIMSPNYEADPQEPKFVRREDWFKPPAAQ